MNEQAIQDAYTLFTQNGYSKSIDEFKVLLNSNTQAIQDAYTLFTQNGYNKSAQEFEILMGVGVKKKDTPEDTVLPSEDGLSAQPTLTPQPEPAPQEVSVVDDTTVISGREERGDTLNVVEPTPEGGVKPELLAKEEEFIIPELEYNYKDLGFKFEKSDPFGDEIKVTADNKKTLTIEADIFLGDKAAEAKKLNDFIEANKIEPQALNTLEQNYQNNKIKFDTEEDVKNSLANLNKEAQNYSSIAEFYLKKRAKVEEERAALEALTSEQRLSQTERIKAFNQQQEELRKLAEPISRVYEEYKGRETRLNQAIGEYYDMRAQQGDYSSGIPRQFVSGKGRELASSTDYLSQLFISGSQNAGMGDNAYRKEFIKRAKAKGLEVPDEANKMSPNELKQFFSGISRTSKTIRTYPGVVVPGQETEREVTFGEDIEAEVFDYAKKYFKGQVDGEGLNMIEDLRKGPINYLKGLEVTEQWVKAKQQEFWGGSILGLAESMPAIMSGMGGNWAKTTADMMLLTSDFLDEEMSKNPAFDNISENEKNAFKLPVAIISGVLETYGLRNIAANSGLRNSILMRILRKPKKDLTGVPFQQIVKNEVDSMLKKGLLTVAGGALTEFETGAAQQIVEIGAKEIFNAVKEKELFQTPESFAEGLGQVLRSGAQEAVGGFIMSVPGAMASAVQEKDFSTIDNNLYEMFKNIRNDKISRTGFVQKIKGQIIRQEITKEQGEKQINDYDKAVALSKEIPVNTPVEQEKVLMGLLLRKQELLDEIEGKDPALVEKQKEEIGQIDDAMKRVLKTTTKPKIKEEGKVEEKPAPLKTKVEKEQAEDIESFFGDEVEETTETVTDNLSINRSKKTKTKSAKVLGTENTIIKIAQRGAKAVSKLLPKTRIILHETTEEFEKFAAPGRGEYDPAADVIHINLEQASLTTVPHEIFHAVFLNKVKTDPAAAQLAETMMKSVRKALPATSELAKRIDTFAESYTDVTELQNEERLAELIGILSSEYKTLSKPNKNKVVKFIENLARQIGVDLKISEFTKTDEDVIDLLNTLAGKVATGEEIVEGDVQILEQGELIPKADGVISDNISESGPSINFPRQQIDPSFQVDNGGIDFNSIRRGSINELSGTNAFVFAADKATFGKIKSPTGLEFDFYGGYLYPYGTQYGWAFTDKISAKKVLNKVKESDGVGLPMSQVPDGITGSFRFFQYLNAEIAHAVNKGVSPKELLNYVNQKLKLTEISLALKAKGLPSQISSLDELNILMPFEGKNKISYLSRGTFAKTFFSAESADKFGIPPLTPTAKIDVGVLDYVNAPSLKDVGYGDIVSAIQFDKNSDIIEVREGDPGYHPSYPYTISGKPIMVFNNAIDVRKVYPNSVPAGPEKTSARPKGVNKTPLGQRAKAQAARSAMGGQYIAKVPDNIDTKGEPKIRKRQQRATEEYISEGRDAGFKDTVIIDYLSRVRKVPMKEIKSAMDIVSEGLGALPASFKNIDGGAQAGVKLFKRIDKKVIQPENKKKKPLAQSQILEKAIAYMQEQPEYENQADSYKVSGETKFRKGLSTQQMLMEIDLQKTLGLRPTQDMSRKLGLARVAVKQRIKGIKDVQKIKTELKNFMRKSLPARVLLSKDAQRMFRYIERVTPDFMQSTQSQGAKIDNVFKEITDFVAEENNKILTKEIQTILDGNYDKTERAKKIGKTIDPETKKRIERIKKMLNFSGLTPKQVNELQAKLTEEFNTLLKETNPTEEQLDRMGDLQLAINYANAEVMENTNPRKTQVLDSVYEGLTSIIELGKQRLKEELEAAAKRYRAEAAAVYEEITGDKLNPDDPDFKKKLAKLQKIQTSEEDRKKLDSKLKKFFRLLRNTLKLPTAESLPFLMDRISSLPGEMMSGKAFELVSDKVDRSTIQYKRRMLAFDRMLQDKLKEYYKKDWIKKSRKFKKDIITIEDSEGIDHFYTQDQMAYLYNQYKNEDTHPAFKNMYGDGYAETMKKIEGLLDKDLKKFADWQVDEYFPAVYDYYNSVYRRIYRTDMPQTKNYGGRVFRQNPEESPESLSLLGDVSTFNTSVTSPSILLRTNPSSKILAMNLTDALVSYTRDMEYFAAYAESIRDIQKLFKNPYIKSAIIRIHGISTYDAIKNLYERIAAKGPQKSKADWYLNKLNSFFITARIGLSPVIAIKQLTSMFTYASDIGIRNWIKYSMKNLPQVVSTWKEIRDNSVYMQDRKNDSILRQIETYANLDSPTSVQWLPSKSKIFYENFIMFTTKFGDRTAIMLGGMPNYLYYKDQYKKNNPGATEQQVIDYAIRKFEKDTKNTQQSSDLQDKDYFQTSDAWVRSMNMFLTTPKQYLRKEISASRNLMRKLRAWDRNAGKGTLTENVRQLLMYHFFMPMLFQWVSSGFPISDWDDEDTEDMFRAAVIGNFNALFIVGELIAKTADAFQNKPWYEDFRQLAVYAQAIQVLSSLNKSLFGKTEKERSEGAIQGALDVLTTIGVPVATLEKFKYNYPKLSQSKDFPEFMLRLLNYSKYQIEGRPKKQGAKKKSMSMTEMKKFYPEMYEMIKDMEDPELKQLEKDMRELEKEMLESMYE